MKCYHGNIEKQTVDNKNYRKVVFTGRYSQLVFMTLKPGEEIGVEIHGVDQFIRVEQGVGKAILDGKKYALEDGWAVIIPAATKHNIINTSKTEDLKLYSIYSLPNHKDKTVHPKKSDEKEEHFDGKMSF